MVGLPGKSKGCHTCRRRKVLCDLQQPNCQRCIQSNRSCEGYDRYPVFLNRTLGGREKMRRLEEAITPSGPVMEPPSPGFSANPPGPYPQSRPDTDSSQERLEYLGNRMASPLDSARTYDRSLVGAFLDIYLPLDANAMGDSMRIWIHEAIDIQDSGRALQPSLRALCMNRVGWANNDNALIMQGRVAYNLALQELQRALWDRDAMYRDETLAAARALMAYDIFESTLGSANSWKAHQAGLERIVQTRGPTSYSSPLGRALLEEIRNTSMFFSIQHRTPSFLGSPVWRTEPWGDKPEDIEQVLYDRGFALAALLEKIDKSTYPNSPDLVNHIIFNYLNELSALDTDFDVWYQELLRVSSSPLYWMPDSEFGHRSENSRLHRRSLGTYDFPSLKLALVTINFWALRLVFSITVSSACDAILRAQRTNPPALNIPFADSINTTPEADGLSLQGKKVVEMAYRHGHDRCFALAVDITRAIPYCTSESMGLFGPQKSLFALRVALFYLRNHPGQELGQCWALYKGLTSKKGIQLAQDLQRAWTQRERVGGSEDVA